MTSIGRRPFMQVLGAAAADLSLAPLSNERKEGGLVQPAGARPNVLFVAFDDLNHWAEPLGGHPQTKTPHLKRFADRNVNFVRSYCASPSCLPSRTALMTGLHPHHNGVYSNYQHWRESLPASAEMLPHYFMSQGYHTAGSGKIFHDANPTSWVDYYPSKERPVAENFRPKPGGLVNMPNFPGVYTDFDWAALDIPDEDMGDYKSVSWVSEQLQKMHDKPFFLGCGMTRPHNPWYVPRAYYDMFPLESIQLPPVREHDLRDTGERATEIAHRGGNYHRHLVEAGLWKNVIQAYLASMAFADAQFGRLMAALERSPHADNTIVVVWSDHGWQFGEKEHWRKFALWENVLRVVTMIRVPKGVAATLPQGTPAGAQCERIVSLVDLFPTLCELCSVEPQPNLDGRSLVPLLKDATTAWDHPALSAYDFAEFSVRVEGWRYTRYIDDSEELYDEARDPYEWTNLAYDPKYADVKRRLAAHIPATQAPITQTYVRGGGPQEPTPTGRTPYKLSPWHVAPFRTKQEYRDYKDRISFGE